MYSLFNQPLTSNIRDVSPSWFERIREVQRDNCKRVISHYRRNAYSTPSDHLIVRLLEVLPRHPELDLMMYRDLIEDITGDIVRAFEFTSPVNVGRSIVPGPFFGDDSEELIVVTNTRFNVSELRNTWRDVSALRFIRHPKTDMNLEVPMGEEYGIEQGPSVILLDLPLLACQYRLWRERELRLRPDFPETTRMFVASYVLPNMLPSLQDVALLNQFLNLHAGIPLSEALDPHPFYLNTRMDKMTEGVVDMLATYKNRRVEFTEFLSAIDGIHRKNLREIVALPSMPFTRQVIWALVIARLPVIQFMLDWYTETGLRYDRQEINEIRRTVQRLRSDHTLDALVSPELREQINDDMEYGIKTKI